MFWNKLREQFVDETTSAIVNDPSAEQSTGPVDLLKLKKRRLGIYVSNLVFLVLFYIVVKVNFSGKLNENEMKPKLSSIFKDGFLKNWIFWVVIILIIMVIAFTIVSYITGENISKHEEDVQGMAIKTKFLSIILLLVQIAMIVFIILIGQHVIARSKITDGTVKNTGNINRYILYRTPDFLLTAIAFISGLLV